MSSQKSIAEISHGVAPKRRRGRDRVEAILDAATGLFAEKPYDAVTMTEVAARSNTAIGSLYRFFPTKEVLADALLERHGTLLSDALAAIAGEASRRPPEEVAAALVDFMLNRSRERVAALGIAEARPEVVAQRRAIRSAVRDGVAAVLAALTGLSPSKLRAEASLLQHVLKTERALIHDSRTAAERAALDRESRRLVRLYLEDLRERRGTAVMRRG